MQIRPSARRHGIADADIRHALGNAFASVAIETHVDGIDGILWVGLDRHGRMLEVLTIEDHHGREIVIHAMKLRKTYEQRLREQGQL